MRGFTLIELMAVIAIIIILAALLTPVVINVIRTAEIRKAQNEVSQLEAAWRAYYMEYRRLPNRSGNVTSTVRDILSGATATDNPRRIQFMEFSEGSISGGNFVDPWGNPYKFALDSNFNNQVNTGDHGTLNRQVAAWSAGPDGDFGSDDDVVSWK